jgi:phosphopantetheinyl transferase
LIEIEQINKSIKLGIIDLHEFNTIHGLVSKREIEKKALIYLLKALNINSDELVYNENNKPFLISGKPFLSITHSFQYLAVVVNSEMLTGIDMELKRLKIINAGNDIDRLTCLWCAKETVYKIYGHKGVNFKDHIKVKPFHTADTVIYASLWVANAWKTFKLALKSKQDYYLTYLIDEV